MPRRIGFVLVLAGGILLPIRVGRIGPVRVVHYSMLERMGIMAHYGPSCRLISAVTNKYGSTIHIFVLYMGEDDLDSRITKAIELVPGIYQNQIVDALKHRANKNTIISRLNWLVKSKAIQRHKGVKYVTYTVTDFDSKKRLDKSLRKHLNGINRIIKKTKSDMPGYYYETKDSLNYYFEREYDNIHERTQTIVANHESARKSRLPYLVDCFGGIENGLDILKKPGSLSAEHHKMLRDVTRKIRERLFKIDDERVEFYEQLEHARGKRARAAIQKKISDGENEWAQLDRDQETISEYVKFGRESLGDIAKGMYEKYLEEKPGVAAEIRGLLSGKDARHESVLWRIIHEVTEEAKNAESQKLLWLKELVSSADPDELARIREHITGWGERVKEAETQLNEIKEWLTAGRPIYNVDESFLSHFPKFDLTPDDKFTIVMEMLTTGADPAKICRRHRITHSMLSSWKRKFLEGSKSALA